MIMVAGGIILALIILGFAANPRLLIVPVAVVGGVLAVGLYYTTSFESACIADKHLEAAWQSLLDAKASADARKQFLEVKCWGPKLDADAAAGQARSDAEMAAAAAQKQRDAQALRAVGIR